MLDDVDPVRFVFTVPIAQPILSPIGRAPDGRTVFRDTEGRLYVR